MSKLSCDILHNIFHRLPATDLIELKPVCKLWKHVIEDPLFVKPYTKSHQSSAASILIRNNNGGKLFPLPLDRLHFAADDVHAIGMIPLKQLIHRGLPLLTELPAPSCNGLILISNHQNINKSWAIWNPLSQDFHEVPPPFPDPRIQPTTFILRSCGFGYDEASDDYKVVRVDCVSYRNKLVNSYSSRRRCMIYSLKLRCWRKMKSFPGDNYRGVGVFLNGALHWKSWRDDKIFVLHLGREDDHLIAMPPRPPPPFTDRIRESLDAIDGCLITSYKGNRSMDVWVMKDYENKVWTKLFSIVDPNGSMGVVAYLKSKGQVFIKHGISGLKWVDLESKCAKEIRVSGCRHPSTLGLSFGQLFPGSIVRLDSTKSRRDGAKRKRKLRKRDNYNYEVYANIGKKTCLHNSLVVYQEDCRHQWRG